MKTYPYIYQATRICGGIPGHVTVAGDEIGRLPKECELISVKYNAGVVNFGTFLVELPRQLLYRLTQPTHRVDVLSFSLRVPFSLVLPRGLCQPD